MIALRDQLTTGDRATVEKVIRSLEGKISGEVVGTIFGWPDGSYVSSSGARGSIADRGCFQDIIAKGQARSVGTAAISKSLGIPLVVIATAVKDPSSAVRGLVGFQFKLESLPAIAATIKVGSTGCGWVVDRRGIVIAHPVKEAILTLDIANADKDGYRGLDAVGKRIVSLPQGLSSSSQALSQGASEQAASIEELSASIEELAATIRQHAENTAQADSLARQVATSAEASGVAVSQAARSMGEIAGKISIIEETSRQTNLLALSAAIEAARSRRTRPRSRRPASGT